MTDAKKVTIPLLQHISHHLKMDMRRPSTIFMPITNMRNQLPRLHPAANVAKGGQSAAKMAVQRIK